MAKDKQNSGLDKVPPIFSKPLWKDRFFWIGVMTTCFWLALIYYFLFR